MPCPAHRHCGQQAPSKPKPPPHNQTRPVTVINLISENTIKHRMLDTLSHKRALSDGVPGPQTGTGWMPPRRSLVRFYGSRFGSFRANHLDHVKGFSAHVPGSSGSLAVHYRLHRLNQLDNHRTPAK